MNEADVVEGRKLIQEVTAKFEKRDVFICGLGVFGGKAAARLTGVLNA